MSLAIDISSSITMVKVAERNRGLRARSYRRKL